MVFVSATIWYLFCGNFHCPFEASNQDVQGLHGRVMMMMIMIMIKMVYLDLIH